MEYFGIFEGLFGPFVLISFRSYTGILTSSQMKQGPSFARCSYAPMSKGCFSAMQSVLELSETALSRDSIVPASTITCKKDQG